MKSFTLPALFSVLLLAASVCAAPVEPDHTTSVDQPAAPSPSHPIAAPDIFRWRRDTSTPPSTQSTADGPEDSPLVANGIFLWRREFETASSTYTNGEPAETSQPPSALAAPGIFQWRRDNSFTPVPTQ